MFKSHMIMTLGLLYMLSPSQNIVYRNTQHSGLLKKKILHTSKYISITNWAMTKRSKIENPSAEKYVCSKCPK